MLFVINLSAQEENSNNDQNQMEQQDQDPGINPFETFADTVQKRINQIDNAITNIENQIMEEGGNEQYQQTVDELDERQRELREKVTQYNRAIEAGAESEAKQLEKEITSLVNEIESDLEELVNEIKGNSKKDEGSKSLR